MANDICKRIGDRLKALRAKRGWNQSYLAEISGVNRSHISEIENGKRDPSVGLLELLATSFDMTISEFMKGI